MVPVTDLTFTSSGELEVTHIEGNTDEGVQFVDSLTLPVMEVVDSGRVIVPTDATGAVLAAARRNTLTVEEVKGL